MASEYDKRLSGHSTSTGASQDMATLMPAPATSTSKEPQEDTRARAYRKHRRQESEATARAQHDALMDSSSVPTAIPPRATAPTQADQPGSQEVANARGFGKLLQKMGLKK